MAKIKTKKKPSVYSALPFHLFRFTQLVSSLIVSAIMFYFIYHLRRDHFKVPWTFLVLLSVALFTIMTQTVTIVFYFCRALNPTVNLVINALLFILWATGFGLLAWAMSGTLVHRCDVANWQNDAGIMVCRLYKALFTFSLTGLISTASALALDFTTRKKELRGGRYVHANDNKSTAALRLTESRDSGGPFDVPRAYAGEQESGYTPPSEQQRYADTEYHHHS
ncbi:hypothetical protein GP486_007343 [Trichoglossum hirsutum]|uniref:MARVEL domain-containing protein n=1 Tax=Trichoglossum hirsutum TaxID=265104 RepID=A0A9P8L2T5_9PEZI|nr:hypothetical protein GP486_007343 [Trichoglossum hirsutum]